eukprot:TRINITY_DN941_c0_g2_i5.p1 TRINITY_DN941_c0_g2~~TRINITY_DN941_c0_g2_i5.p1  ORF type:complete len:149 (+),score=28.47 TRINITY_DN941_c0_g2_i5:26-472(+)
MNFWFFKFIFSGLKLKFFPLKIPKNSQKKCSKMLKKSLKSLKTLKISQKWLKKKSSFGPFFENFELISVSFSVFSDDFVGFFAKIEFFRRLERRNFRKSDREFGEIAHFLAGIPIFRVKNGDRCQKNAVFRAFFSWEMSVFGWKMSVF